MNISLLTFQICITIDYLTTSCSASGLWIILFCYALQKYNLTRWDWTIDWCCIHFCCCVLMHKIQVLRSGCMSNILDPCANLLRMTIIWYCSLSVNIKGTMWGFFRLFYLRGSWEMTFLMWVQSMWNNGYLKLILFIKYFWALENSGSDDRVRH